MRVALIAESFLPHMNGVTHSLLQVIRHLEAAGHETLVVAPRSGRTRPETEAGELALLRSVPLPGYPQVRLVVASTARLTALLRDFAPDVVHLASPFLLGWQAVRAAERLGIPTVAVYQTDIPAYARRYGIAGAEAGLGRHLARLHQRATITLAPSTAACDDLAVLGVPRVRRWARGVDAERFHPSRRDAARRARLAPGGEVLVGYVGRLAPEKQVEDLAALAGLPGIRLVIIGDGPDRARLEQLLPDAAFLGFRSGDALAADVASLDLFVHPGESETFCQTVQEALASGVPVVATGRGGPRDLVDSGRTGWLYRPGDLAELRSRVADLAGDAAKRRAFAVAARAAVERRSWSALGEELLGHYRAALVIGAGEQLPPAVGAPPAEPVALARRITRFAALGDSLTEGLCDTSRQAPGEYRGWTDRLALLLAHAEGRREPLHYGNLAVRSRRVGDVLTEQLPRARELGADFVTVLIGANDLVRVGAPTLRLAAELADGVDALRAGGAEVLLVAPFAPPRGYLRALDDRALVFARELRRRARESGALFLDPAQQLDLADPRMWAGDRVHLSSRGHRMLSYLAAEALGLADAVQLAALEAAIHDEEPGADDEPLTHARWLWTHVRPWAARRIRGRTAGDGRVAKHDELVPILPAARPGVPHPIR
ncbi:glycosyltransferase [Protaetiibacter intestinalis]|uniref:D-inositol 3-phosphate glycosyltransferase n=1 Tax=Protaetiibacter intestinalis TaxID=2419774 RepID=A0A387B550_9MICO|nr:glycosyltransferase [Protaetiibacter intestinalis]AYF96831.1 glycosyltransferase [Protaetiibacter intestinalis]